MGEDPEAREAGPESVGELLRLLDLELLDRDLYRAHNPVDPVRRRLFGGQVAAQALRAATHSVSPDRLVHSLHGYFLRPGRTDMPTILHVDRDRDGRSLSARRVTAVQSGEVIFTLSVSFQVSEAGPEFQSRLAAEIPRPEDLGGQVFDLGRHHRLFEMRAVTELNSHGLPDVYWARSRSPLPEDPFVHACVLTYLSDMGVGEGELRPHVDLMQRPSVDHAVWFHRPCRMDDWVLFSMRPLSAQAGRCLYTGEFHSLGGELVATMVQECLLRPLPRT
jgi:acyl-CoA thioesterase-2